MNPLKKRKTSQRWTQKGLDIHRDATEATPHPVAYPGRHNCPKNHLAYSTVTPYTLAQVLLLQAQFGPDGKTRAAESYQPPHPVAWHDLSIGLSMVTPLPSGFENVPHTLDDVVGSLNEAHALAVAGDIAGGCDPEFTVKANLDRKGRDATLKGVSSRLKERERERKRKPCQPKPMNDMNAGSPRYRMS